MQQMCIRHMGGGTSKKCRMSSAVPVRVNVSVVLTIFWYGDASVEKVNVLQRRVPKNWGQLPTWPPNGKIFPSLDFFFIFKDDNVRSQLYQNRLDISVWPDKELNK